MSLAVSSSGAKVHFINGRFIGQVFGGSPGDSGESALVEGTVTRSKYLRDQIGGAISPDGTRVATMKRVTGGSVVELDGAPGPTMLSVANTAPIFSQNGKRLAYQAVPKTGCTVYVVDQKVGDCFARVGTAVFSPDGSRFAFIGITGKSSVLVSDGVAGNEYEGIASPVFSADGKQLAYWALRAGAWYLVVNGREDGPFEAAKAPFPTFSPSGKLLYVGVRQSKIQLLLSGETIGESAKGFASPAFSATGRLAVYRFEQAGVTVLLDGKPVGTYDGAAGGIAFSPDGKRLAYGVKRGSDFYVVVDGVEHGPWQNLDGSAPAFSPDGRHVAWAAARGGVYRVVVDGVEAETAFPGVFRGGSIVFTSPTRLHVLVLMGDMPSVTGGTLARVARLDIAIAR